MLCRSRQSQLRSLWSENNMTTCKPTLFSRWKQLKNENRHLMLTPHSIKEITTVVPVKKTLQRKHQSHELLSNQMKQAIQPRLKNTVKWMQLRKLKALQGWDGFAKAARPRARAPMHGDRTLRGKSFCSFPTINQAQLQGFIYEITLCMQNSWKFLV